MHHSYNALTTYVKLSYLQLKLYMRKVLSPFHLLKDFVVARNKNKRNGFSDTIFPNLNMKTG